MHVYKEVSAWITFVRRCTRYILGRNTEYKQVFFFATQYLKVPFLPTHFWFLNRSVQDTWNLGAILEIQPIFPTVQGEPLYQNQSVNQKYSPTEGIVQCTIALQKVKCSGRLFSPVVNHFFGFLTNLFFGENAQSRSKLGAGT